VKRVLVSVIVFAIVFAILLQVAAATLLGTEAGSRWLVYRLLPLVPGELQVERVTGTVYDGLTLDNVEYRHAAVTLRLSRGQIRVDWSRLWHGWLSLDSLDLNQLHIVLAESGDKTATPLALPDDLTLPFGVSLARSNLTALSIDRGDTALLALDHITLIEARARRQLSLARLDIRADEHRLAVAALNMSLRSPYELNAGLEWSSRIAALTPWLGDDEVAGAATLSGSLQVLNIRHALSRPRILNSELSLNPFSAPLLLTSTHQWQQLTLTLPDQSSLYLQQGRLALDLEGSRFRAEFDSGLRRDGLPPASLQIRAEGTPEGSDHVRAALRHGDAMLSLSGDLAWRPALAFNLNVDGRRLDPALFLSSLPGRLDIQASVQGRQQADGWQVSARDAVVRGELLGQPIMVSGNTALTPSLFSVNARAEYGDNRLSVDGRGNQQLDLRGELEIREPSVLHPDLRGTLDASMRLYGTREQPLADVDASSASVGYQALRLDDIQLRARALGVHSDKLSLTWQSGRLSQLGQLLLSETRATLTGDSRRHTLAWSVRQPDAALAAQLSGQLDPDALRWQGTLDDLLLSLTEFSDWRLLAPIALSASRNNLTLPQTCLSDGVGRACTSVRLGDDLLDAELSITGLPLGPFSALIGPAVQLEGTLEHDSHIRRDAQQRWQGVIKSRIHQGAVLLEDGPLDYRVELEQATLDSHISHPLVHSTATLGIRDHGSASAELQTHLFDVDAPLKGRAELALSELRWLELIVPGLRQISGNLNGELLLEGSRRLPRLNGNIQLTNGEADVPDAGITLREIQASLRAQQSRIELAGTVQSGPGNLEARGAHDFSEGLPGRLNMALTGQRFRAVNLPDISVLVNPDLRITTTPGRLHVRGEVLVPEARMTPVELPQVAVRVSEDEVLINAPESMEKTLALDAEVMLRLGREVHFRGFGLDARLGGNLLLIEKPDLPLNLQGDLRIEEGRYRAYGQNLAIDRGVLLFQDQIDNPGLDIRAVRRIPSAQVVAGVAITGTLKEPEARLYSEPAMEESEAMAWLLTGRGLTGTAQNDNAMIAQALAVYGLERGSGVTESIGDRLGLDEISLGSDWETSDAALMLGKQINDRLYLRYAIGLFDAVSTVMLRYTLSRKIHLEAQSGGDRQSLDLIYQIER
jgi:translocation and assembly module TamB